MVWTVGGAVTAAIPTGVTIQPATAAVYLDGPVCDPESSVKPANVF